MKYKFPNPEVKKKNNELYYNNIVTIESLFSTLKTTVPLAFLGQMLNYLEYPLISIAVILFISTIIFSFSHLIMIIGYIKIENDAFQEFKSLMYSFSKKFKMEENECIFLGKKIAFNMMRLYGILSNTTFISAMILILITVILNTKI